MKARTSPLPAPMPAAVQQPQHDIQCFLMAAHASRALTRPEPCPVRSCTLGTREGMSSAVDLTECPASCPAAAPALCSSSGNPCTRATCASCTAHECHAASSCSQINKLAALSRTAEATKQLQLGCCAGIAFKLTSGATASPAMPIRDRKRPRPDARGARDCDRASWPSLSPPGSAAPEPEEATVGGNACADEV